MRQVIYISTTTQSAAPASVEAILTQSQRNNASDQVTGLLYFDGRRFLQALEGPADAVARALQRIEKDPRHRAIVVLSDRTIEHRDFGSWAMAARTPGVASTAFLDQVATLVKDASPSVRATFNSFAEVRSAA